MEQQPPTYSKNDFAVFFHPDKYDGSEPPIGLHDHLRKDWRQLRPHVRRSVIALSYFSVRPPKGWTPPALAGWTPAPEPTVEEPAAAPDVDLDASDELVDEEA